MGVFNFRTTGNESLLFDRVFPIGYDITEAHKDDLSKYKSIGTAPAKICGLALDNCGVYAIEPANWVRLLSKEDKGTEDSHNWPDPVCRFSVRLSDVREAALVNLSTRLFAGNKTTAMVWAITNFNALLNSRPNLMMEVKAERREKMTAETSKLVSIRLPLDLLNDYSEEARRRQITVGRLIRTQLINTWAGTKQIINVADAKPQDDEEDFLDDFE